MKEAGTGIPAVVSSSVLCPMSRLLIFTARINEITTSKAPIPILPIASKTGFSVIIDNATAARAKESPSNAAVSSPRTIINSL